VIDEVFMLVLWAAMVVMLILGANRLTNRPMGWLPPAVCLMASANWLAWHRFGASIASRTMPEGVAFLSLILLVRWIVLKRKQVKHRENPA